MPELVYPRERTLGLITLVLGLIVWIALIAGTFGVALIFLAGGFVAYFFCPVCPDCAHQGQRC